MSNRILGSAVALILLATTSDAQLAIAHRGASGYAPEHTIVAYDRALELSADYIEQDLQLTKDGVLVAMHDPTLDRTARGDAANCTGRVIDKTLARGGFRACERGARVASRTAGFAPLLLRATLVTAW